MDYYEAIMLASNGNGYETEELMSQYADEVDSANSSSRLVHKANRLNRRKREVEARDRKYACKVAKLSKRYGHKAIRSAMERGPKYGQLYQFEHEGSTYLTWNETDSMRAWRNRKGSEVISYEAD